MDVKHFEMIVVRTDEGKPIYGHLVLAQKRPNAD